MWGLKDSDGFDQHQAGEMLTHLPSSTYRDSMKLFALGKYFAPWENCLAVDACKEHFFGEGSTLRFNANDGNNAVIGNVLM